MRRVPLDRVEVGAVLGKTLYNERGDVLLRRGAELGPRYLNLLREKGFRTVYLHDPDTEDIDLDDIVSEHVRATATKNIYRFMQVVENASYQIGRASSERLVAAFGSGEFRRELTGSAYEQLNKVVESIIDEVLDAATLSGMTALKTHDNYTFCHSVDVTITAIMLGKKLYFDRPALRQLALGCLLHDTGKMFIEPLILNKPGKLTPNEFELIKKHPTLGYQLLRSIQKHEFLANHVAYQHHERQDGNGYPRGMRGVNRVARDAVRGDRILMIAEIAAVADVYDAMSSDRPYRSGMAPEQIVEQMRQMAGPHLNKEIVQHFLAILPVYPVGLEVRITQGRLKGYRGVVARLHPRAMDRPVVRVLYDDRDHRVQAFDYDMLKEKGAAVAGTFTPGALPQAS
jgi:HD-GYP domain-containing protein (c-di-GMP phosphodiesterase class II)